MSLCVLKYLTVDFNQKRKVENVVSSSLLCVFFVFFPLVVVLGLGFHLPELY